MTDYVANLKKNYDDMLADRNRERDTATEWFSRYTHQQHRADTLAREVARVTQERDTAQKAWQLAQIALGRQDAQITRLQAQRVTLPAATPACPSHTVRKGACGWCEVARLRGALQRIQAACGRPDAASACRTILVIARATLTDGRRG